MQADRTGGEVALDRFGELASVDKEVQGIGQDHGVGYEDGIAMHVGAAQVGEPGHLVECRHYHGIGAGFAQGRAQAPYFEFHFFTGIFQGLHFDGPLRQGRAVSPKRGKGVFADAEAHAARSQFMGQGAHLRTDVNPSVKPHL